MKIARYIADLLYDYECVVIPGLGGFIARNHNASIHPVKNQFRPPFKEVVFNPHLRTNDGLLLNHIAITEKLTYQDAKGRLDRFVLKCLQEMEKGRRIAFRRIGSIYLNQEHVVQFEADESQNYLASSFGLSSFVAHPVVRGTFQEKKSKTIAETPAPAVRESAARPISQRHKVTSTVSQSRTAPQVQHRQIAAKRSSPYKKQFTFLFVLLFSLFIGWGVMNKHTVQYYYSSYASLVPFFYASPNEYIVNNMDKLPIDKYLPLKSKEEAPARDERVLLQPANNNLLQSKALPIENLYVDDDELIGEQDSALVNDTYLNPASDNKEIIVGSTEPLVTENKVENIVPEASPVKKEPKQIKTSVSSTDVAAVDADAKYFIIAGAFREKENAEKLIRQLSGKGYSPSYAGQTKTGLWRVSYVAFRSKNDALKRLQTIKSEEDSNAWLFSL